MFSDLMSEILVLVVLKVLECSAGVGKFCSCGSAVSNIVHSRVLFNGGSWAGVRMVAESNTVLEGSNRNSL